VIVDAEQDVREVGLGCTGPHCARDFVPRSSRGVISVAPTSA
jgi:hypothetical protein